MTLAQCRMARAGLRWGVRDLASLAGVAPATVVRFENEQKTPIKATLEAMQRALEGGGVECRSGDGLRLRPSTPAVAPPPPTGKPSYNWPGFEATRGAIESVTSSKPALRTDERGDQKERTYKEVWVGCPEK